MCIRDSVKVVDTIQVNTELEGVDALVTDIPGYCLCVSPADCVTVLLYDTRKKVVAAIHAGWRGTCLLYTSFIKKVIYQTFRWPKLCNR